MEEESNRTELLEEIEKLQKLNAELEDAIREGIMRGLETSERVGQSIGIEETAIQAAAGGRGAVISEYDTLESKENVIEQMDAMRRLLILMEEEKDELMKDAASLPRIQQAVETQHQRLSSMAFELTNETLILEHSRAKVKALETAIEARTKAVTAPKGKEPPTTEQSEVLRTENIELKLKLLCLEAELEELKRQKKPFTDFSMVDDVVQHLTILKVGEKSLEIAKKGIMEQVDVIEQKVASIQETIKDGNQEDVMELQEQIEELLQMDESPRLTMVLKQLADLEEENRRLKAFRTKTGF